MISTNHSTFACKVVQARVPVTVTIERVCGVGGQVAAPEILAIACERGPRCSIEGRYDHCPLKKGETA